MQLSSCIGQHIIFSVALKPLYYFLQTCSVILREGGRLNIWQTRHISWMFCHWTDLNHWLGVLPKTTVDKVYQIQTHSHYYSIWHGPCLNNCSECAKNVGCLCTINQPITLEASRSSPWIRLVLPRSVIWIFPTVRNIPHINNHIYKHDIWCSPFPYESLNNHCKWTENEIRSN